jgi:diadenosine tetraphosphate (Ap4A) HIT family hydrolase
MLERMWSGWRSSYVSSVGTVDDAGEGSVFTRILTSGLSDDEANIVHRGPTCFAILNAYPYGTGHLLVLPYRELADLEELTADETSELWATVTDAVRAVKTAYHPEGVNVGVNLGAPAGGSVSDHLHVHVVPRWTGDANFMTAIANTRTLPEPLAETATKIRIAWPSDAS